MTLQDFINKWNGKYLTVLSPGKQCFDLCVGWTDNLGVPHYQGNPSPFPYANAYQIYTDFGAFQSQYFDKIANSPTGVPQSGDIVVWSSGYGQAGHVAVATGVGNTNTFQVFSQNDPTGSVCVLKTYNYNYVFGWLRFKGQQPTNTDALSECLKLHADVLKQLEVQKKANSDLSIVIDQKNKEIGNLNNALNEKNKAIEDLKQVNTALQSACNDKLSESSLVCLQEKKAIQEKCDNTIANYKTKLKLTTKGLLVLILDKLG